MVQAKVYKFIRHFEGYPKDGDLDIIEEDLPPIKDGEFLAAAIYFSVDPYMRAYSNTVPLGSTFDGSQVAKIIDSKHPDFPVGKYVLGYFGWRTHTISNGDADSTFNQKPYVIPDFGGLPISLALGVLGMPGNTAYFGFLEVCKPKTGETLVVSGAAGAVGSLVGQIAKMKGCKVIGIAGSDDKGKWLTKELGFDHFINYKTQDVEKALKVAAPQGVDCYFDNVGGDLSYIVMNQMNKYGRISVCGFISSYNDKEPAKSSIVQFPIVFKELKMEGFIVFRWQDRWFEGISQSLQWIKEGKLKYRETVSEGFENLLSAFVDMLKGQNFGKAVVKV